MTTFRRRYPAIAALVALALILAVLGLPASPPQPLAAAPVCLDGNPQGWCRVADPVVRFKDVTLSPTSSALVGGGRTTRYAIFAAISYQDRQMIVAPEDGGFAAYRYPFGALDPSACTFIAHDDGTTIGFKGFCAQYRGDNAPRTLVVWDSGWRYFGP